jgi:hypothetical protein
VLLKNGKPAANEKVIATRVELPYASIHLAGENFTVETDKGGRFLFDHTLPSGRVTLVAFDQIQKNVSVRAGITTDITFDCAGKEIKGSLMYAGPEQIDWSAGHILLLAHKAAQPAPALDNLPDDTEDEECYAVEIDSDGTFSAPMIPPGNYKLSLRCGVVPDAVKSTHLAVQPLTFSGNIVVSAGEKPEKFHVMLTKEEQTIDEP